MTELTALLAQHGLLVVFANVFLTQAGVPVPAIPLLVVAGALVQEGQLSLAAVMAVAVIAALLGDLPWYAAGRMAGHRVLRLLCRVAIEPDSCVMQTENTFERWGAPSLMVAKFVPGFATVAPPIAGAMHLKLAPFLLYSALGAGLWAGAAVAAGMVFHAQIDQLLAWLANMGLGTALVMGLTVGFYVAFKWLERYMFIRLMRMARITADELHDMMRQGMKLVILDVRSHAARKLDPRRIPGAIAVDIAAPDRNLADVPPDGEVVIYCT
jgi:membrane protein DedA with SNARE-associated domain